MAGIQVLDRAFGILEIVGREPDAPHYMSVLAEELAIGQSTCANIVKSLVRHGYLEQMPDRKGYRLGPTPHTLTRNRPYKKFIVDVAYPHVKKLVSSVNETCLVSVLKYTNKVVLFHVEKNSTLQVRTDLIEEQNPYETATGRLLIAALNDRERTQLVEELGLPGPMWNGIADMRSFVEACTEVRSNGYCIGKKPGEGPIGIAYPVFHRGEVEAALGLYLEERDFVGAHKKRIIAGMSDTATMISDQLDNPEAVPAGSGWQQQEERDGS